MGYKINIAGCERELDIFELNENLDIAGFIMFSDVEVTVASAKALLEKVPEFDIILTAECKGIPLAYEMSRQCGKTYVVARKSVKGYMKNPLKVSVQSITTKGVQTLYLDNAKAQMLKGKKVLIVDDVISTGESLKALEKLCGEAGAEVAGKAAVLAEGDASKRDDIIFLEPLPLFPKSKVK